VQNMNWQKETLSKNKKKDAHETLKVAQDGIKRGTAEIRRLEKSQEDLNQTRHKLVTSLKSILNRETERKRQKEEEKQRQEMEQQKAQQTAALEALMQIKNAQLFNSQLFNALINNHLTTNQLYANSPISNTPNTGNTSPMISNRYHPYQPSLPIDSAAAIAQQQKNRFNQIQQFQQQQQAQQIMQQQQQLPNNIAAVAAQYLRHHYLSTFQQSADIPTHVPSGSTVPAELTHHIIPNSSTLTTIPPELYQALFSTAELKP